MAEQNGDAQPAAAAVPKFSVLAQYAKDFSFENPNAPKSLSPGSSPPQISVQINVDAKPLSDTDVEVSLKIEGKAEMTDTLLFRLELDYAGVFRIQNVPKESLNPIVLIECPRLLFPFAREIIASTVRSGGFPPLLLDPVDFAGLYRQKMNELHPAGATPPQT